MWNKFEGERSGLWGGVVARYGPVGRGRQRVEQVEWVRGDKSVNKRKKSENGDGSKSIAPSRVIASFGGKTIDMMDGLWPTSE